MDFWERLRSLCITPSGASFAVIAALGALFMRRLLPTQRARRGKATVVILLVAPLMHLLATGAGLLGLGATSAVLHAADLLFLALGVTGVLSLLIFDVTLGRTRIPTIAGDVLQGLAFILVVFSVLRAGGLDPLSLATTSAVLTCALGIALQGVIANLFAGMALQLDRSFAVGDWIQVGGRAGRVEQIRWRAIAIHTREGDTAQIPNAALIANEVLTIATPGGRHLLSFAVAFHHRHPPEEVSDAIVRVAAGVPGVLAEPPPTCSPDEFLPGAIVYRVRFWIRDLSLEPKVAADVKVRTWYAAQRAGLEGPCPAGADLVPEVDGDLALRRTAHDRAIEDRVAALGRVAVLAALDVEERDRIARGLREVLFARGERILAQGEPGDSLYVLVRGEVQVEVETAGARREVARIGPGEVFGEMSLFTGEPRQASCAALTEVRCYLVDYALARQVLANRPAAAVEISATLARRLSALDGERAYLARAADERGGDAPTRLLARMKAYFRLA